MDAEKKQQLPSPSAVSDVGAWAMNVISSVGIIMANKQLMSAGGYAFSFVTQPPPRMLAEMNRKGGVKANSRRRQELSSKMRKGPTSLDNLDVRIGKASTIPISFPIPCPPPSDSSLWLWTSVRRRRLAGTLPRCSLWDCVVS